MTISSEEYLVYEGSVCPVCMSRNIEGQEDIEQAGTEAWQGITCNDCHATWSDTYELIGYDNLVPGQPVKDMTDIIREHEENES